MIGAAYLPRWEDVVAFDGTSMVPELALTHPLVEERFLWAWPYAADAFRIATIAHAAVGQRRADKVTPYISHPVHVAALAISWAKELRWEDDAIQGAAALALLHDVLEDTKLTANELAALGMPARVVSDVVTMTKDKPEAYEGAPYFEACCLRPTTWLVKVADRASNLMSAAAEAVPGERNQRWRNYIQRTRSEMLPVYEHRMPEGISGVQRDYVLDHLLTALRACEAACG